MVDVYLSSGHGRRPDGSYDPGAIATGGTEEHQLVERVVRVVDAALRRSGVAVVADECPDPRSGRSHAPNFYGSSVRAETLRPKVAVELHFDWRKAPRGGFGIYGSAYGHHLSDAIRARYRTAGLPVRAHQYRLLYFVRSTSMPAILWECDRVASHSPEHLTAIGEAIAAGICDHLGATYQPPSPRRYSMVIYAARGSVDAQSALAAHATAPVGVVTMSLDEAREALARGEPVVAVGGPACDDLSGTRARMVRGATGADTLRLVADLAAQGWQ